MDKISGVNILESYTDNIKTRTTLVDAIGKKTVQNSSPYQNSVCSLEGNKKLEVLEG